MRLSEFLLRDYDDYFFRDHKHGVPLASLKKYGYDFHSRFGDFDLIHAWYADCVWGPSKETLVFTDRFDELDQICFLPSPFTSYVGLTFFKDGKEVGSGAYLADMDDIRELASSVLRE